MAIFLSKRLLRFTLFTAACLGILFFLLSNENFSRSTNNVSDMLKNIGLDTGPFYSGTKPLTSEEKEEEELRFKAEQSKSKQQENDESASTEDENIDENAQALKETAEADTQKVYSSTWDYMAPSYADKTSKPKAAFVVLARNSDLNDILKSVKLVEEKFNKNFHYPWVFFNEEEFSEEFKTKIDKAASSTVEYGLIPKEHWSYPDDIDQEKARDSRESMHNDGVVYGGVESYRHMCRFQSGFFWRQKLLEKYDWYWRVEPNIKLYCDIPYDVFEYMRDNEKVYGFTITIHEYLRTIESLWETVTSFWKKNPEYVVKDNLLEFISGDKGKTYNLCHFWSNFEIANLNFWRSPAYTEFFEYLDKTGNFFYERWGDAPVHSIAAALFLSKEKIHYFSDIGYHHAPYDNCPLDLSVYASNKCECDPENDFTFMPYACGVEYYDAQGLKKPDDWERRHQ